MSTKKKSKTVTLAPINLYTFNQRRQTLFFFLTRRRQTHERINFTIHYMVAIYRNSEPFLRIKKIPIY